MHKMSGWMVGAFAAFMAVGAAADESAFTWPESGDATIPKGVTVVVTDSDYDRVNALTSITISDGATNIFQTSKAPTTQILGSGAWVKRGDAYWTLSVEQRKFYGSMIIEAGVVTNATAYGKGWPWSDNNDKRTFTIKEGAMFVNTASNEGVSFGPHRIHIKGTGVNGEGVMVNLSSKVITLCKLKLDGDAKISSLSANGYFTLGPYSDIQGRCELNGYTLTVDTKQTLNMYRSELVGDQGGLIRITGGNLTFGAEYGKDSPFLCREPNAGAFAMANSGFIYVKRDVPNIQVPLTIESGCDVMLKHIHENYPSNCEYHPDTNAWAGTVTIEDGAVLRMRTNRELGGKYFRISGLLAGSGNLIPLSPERYNPVSGDIYIESPTNTFAGTIFVGTNMNSGSMYFSYSNSVPDYSKCELVDGYLTARLTPGDHAWTPASISAFANGVNRSGETFIAMDASQMPEGKASFSVSEFEVSKDKGFYELGVDGGTVEVSGKAESPVSLFSVSGTLRFTGEATLTNTCATSVGTNRFGEILFDGAKITTGIDGAYLGVFPRNSQNAWPLDASPVGRMRVRNSEFKTDYACTWTGEHPSSIEDGKVVTNLFNGAVKVGWKGRGIFEIEGNSVVSNRFLIGCTYNSQYPNPVVSYHCQYGYGAVYQRDGEVALIGNKWWDNAVFATGLGFGSKSFGYYEASGGRTVLAGQFNCGSYGTGVIYVDGGDMVATNHPAEASTKAPVLYFASANYSKCALYVKNGGRFYTHGETRTLINAASGMYGNFTASGEGSYMGLGQLVLGSKNVPLGNTAFFNAVDGGTVEAWRFCANNITPETNFVCVGFNGGTVKARSNGYAIFGSITTSDGTGPETVVRVYEKGGAVDTAGHKEIFSDAPIKAAHGGGVASVSWTPRTGCQYPPVVQIFGDGYGASALAEFDSRSGTVTGITVTSPGCGYTRAKAVFTFGYEGTAASIVAITNDCVIAQNDGKGSFAKKGGGTLTLRTENNWGGDTILAGGVLKSGVDGAIPAGGTFVLAGGTLDMNGTVLSDGTTLPKKWAIDVNMALENGAVVYDGDLTFPEGSTLDLRGEEVLTDNNSNMTLLTVTGTLSGAPALPALNNPRWKAWWRGNSIRLTKSYGTTVVFR